MGPPDLVDQLRSTSASHSSEDVGSLPERGLLPRHSHLQSSYDLESRRDARGKSLDVIRLDNFFSFFLLIGRSIL